MEKRRRCGNRASSWLEGMVISQRTVSSFPPRRRAPRALIVVGVVVLVATLIVGCHTVLGAVSSVSDVRSTPADPDRTDLDRVDLTAADGLLPDSATIFDDYPGITNLDPALLAAVRRAADDSGLTVFVSSGWRSTAYQEVLLREAVAEYGSRAEAARWVATPDTSAHVSGAAIDVGWTAVDEWLIAHGAAYGLCQTYLNEPWHFELVDDAASDGCPKPFRDPTQDPRLQP